MASQQSCLHLRLASLKQTLLPFQNGVPVLGPYFDGKYQYSSEREFLTGEFSRNVAILKETVDLGFLDGIKPKWKI